MAQERAIENGRTQAIATCLPCRKTKRVRVLMVPAGGRQMPRTQRLVGGVCGAVCVRWTGQREREREKPKFRKSKAQHSRFPKTRKGCYRTTEKECV